MGGISAAQSMAKMQVVDAAIQILITGNASNGQPVAPKRGFGGVDQGSGNDGFTAFACEGRNHLRVQQPARYGDIGHIPACTNDCGAVFGDIAFRQRRGVEARLNLSGDRC